MEALKLLLTTAVGLMSLGVSLFIIVMGFYLRSHLTMLTNEKSGIEGWH